MADRDLAAALGYTTNGGIVDALFGEITGPARVNQNIAKQVQRSRQAFNRPPPAQGVRGALDYASGITMGLPIIGDLFGLGRDIAQFRAEPESRTPLNFGLAALGLIPFVPPAVSYGLGRLAQSRGVEIAPPPSGPAASQAGAIVYHGSPHKFDRFDSSKIGTGEGAQVYGSGLYFAESPGVAGQYKASTSANMYETSKGIIRSSDLVDELFKASGDVPKSLESSYRAKANEVVRDLIMGKSAQDIANEIKSSKYGRSYGKLVEAVEKLSPKTAEGSFYSVDLPDPMIARMLDWDKPLAQQPDVLNALQKSKSQTVRKFLENVNTPGQYSGELPSGESLVRHLSMQASGKQIDPKASLTLQKAGIPGIRYLDRDSRFGGAGTSNFVVFPGEESATRILERNGIPVQPTSVEYSDPFVDTTR